MQKVLFDAYFEDTTPVIIVDIDIMHENPLYEGLMDDLDKALTESGMEKVKEQVYKQTRGGLDIKLLKTKMRKKDFKLVRGKTSLDKPIVPNVDYLHFIKGDLIEVYDEVLPYGVSHYYFYEYNFHLYCYTLDEFDCTTIYNDSKTEGIKLNTYFAVIYGRLGSAKIIDKFIAKNPSYKGQYKNPVDRYYHTVEKV